VNLPRGGVSWRNDLADAIADVGGGQDRRGEVATKDADRAPLGQDHCGEVAAKDDDRASLPTKFEKDVVGGVCGTTEDMQWPADALRACDGPGLADLPVDSERPILLRWI